MIDQKVSKYLGPLSLLKNGSVIKMVINFQVRKRPFIVVLYFKTRGSHKQTLFCRYGASQPIGAYFQPNLTYKTNIVIVFPTYS